MYVRLISMFGINLHNLILMLSFMFGVLGKGSNTTLRILSVRGGAPAPPFTDFFSGKEGVTDLGGTPPPPVYGFSP